MNRRLTRSRTDQILGGVAAGLARYLNTDPALVRIAWALLVPLTNGAALLAYIVAWVVVPEEDAPVTRTETADGTVVEEKGVVADGSPRATAAEPARRRDDNRAGIVVGVGLVLIGAWFLAREYLPAFNWGLVWPLVLVGIGILILVNSARRNA